MPTVCQAYLNISCMLYNDMKNVRRNPPGLTLRRKIHSVLTKRKFNEAEEVISIPITVGPSPDVVSWQAIGSSSYAQ